MKLVSDILLHGAERFGARTALADPLESVTYGELASFAGRLALALQTLGLPARERSLVVLPNSVNFVRAHFANLLAGLVSVPCDAGLTGETLASLAASCTPRCLITDAATLARLTESQPLPPCIEEVILLGAGAATVLGSPRRWSAAELVTGQPERLAAPARGEHDLAALMYTTGTTGRPKGVQLTHANILAALRSIVEFVGYTSDDREVVVLPLSHNFGLGHVYCNLMSGGAVYTEPGLTRVGRVLKAVESFRATGFPGTPLGFGLLLDQYAPVLAQRARHLRFSVINSAPLPPERAAQLQALLPQLDIMVYYGLTEASRTAFISLTQAGPSHYRTVGQPMKHVEVRVLGADGKPLPAGETGEIVVRGPALTPGYWNSPDETAAVIRDGWFHTGDLGHLDASGYLWITGRLKDVINVGGYKVNPTEVERVLAVLPGIVDAGVVGLDGLAGLTGESVVAALILADGVELNAADLEQQCAARLEKFKVPTRFVRLTAIPRTDTGKTKRAELAVAARAALQGES